MWYCCTEGNWDRLRCYSIFVDSEHEGKNKNDWEYNNMKEKEQEA